MKFDQIENPNSIRFSSEKFLFEVISGIEW